ncbi:hypothetical protein KCA24_33795, partial [Escherichia coli]|nr:hypothetical protein [Escherichia coli]
KGYKKQVFFFLKKKKKKKKKKTKTTRFPPVCFKKLRFPTPLVVPRNLPSRQRHNVQFSPQTTQPTTNKNTRSKSLPLRYTTI